MNQTSNDILIVDLGIVVPGSGSIDLNSSITTGEVYDSVDLVTEINAGNILINNGSETFDQANSLNFVAQYNATESNFLTKAEILAISNPKDYQEVFNSDDGYKYFYDPQRTKWLTVDTTTLQFGRNGSVDGSVLHFNHMLDFNSGPLVGKDGTIVAVTSQSDGGNSSKGFEVRMNNVSVFSYSLSSEKFNSQSVNVDISSGEYMTVYALASGSSVSDPTA